MDKAIPKISNLIKVKQLGKLTGTSFQNHLVGDFRGSSRKKGQKQKAKKKKKRNILSDFINYFYKAIFLTFSVLYNSEL